MIPYFQNESVTIYNADCHNALKLLADCSIDAIVTDPPAGISFMGKAWDDDKGGRHQWVAWLTEIMRECLRVLKPGGHGLVWALPRTSHWTAWALEDAGFEVRDRVSHLFGTGFPKSLDVSKAIDEYLGVERVPSGATTSLQCEFVRRGEHCRGHGDGYENSQSSRTIHALPTSAATWAARLWQGYGTALKPACEDWWLVRKPLDGTVAQNVLKHGVGGLNIDGCRIGDEERLNLSASHNEIYGQFKGAETEGRIALGRWPANITHDGSDEVVRLFPVGHNDNGGSAARFFYTAKPDRRERDEGLDDLSLRSAGEVTDRVDGSNGLNSPRAGAGRTGGGRNHHPTVKPLSLMRYLCRLITPPGGLILDPFGGSGSTGRAAMQEEMRAILIELSPEYCEIAARRCAEPVQAGLFKMTAERVEPPTCAQEGLFATAGVE